MRTVIRVSCIDQQLKSVASPLLASGGMNEAVVAFDFCEKWDGFAKTGVFYRDDEDVYYSLLDENDECIIPHEVYDEPGTFYFTVFGDKDDIRRTASTLRYKAYKGVVGDAMKPSDPTPDVYDQIMASVAEMNEKAESGALTGPKGDPGYTPIKGVDYFDGEKGEKGDKGDPGYTPVKGVDYHDGEKGNDGYTPVKGIDYFDGKDGRDGQDGKDGKDGINGKDGYTPVKGTDYFTEEDKAEIAEQAAGLVEIPEGGGGNSVYFSEEEPTDAKSGDFWYDESEGEEVTQPLTFTGAVEATYDGSKPVEVEIPKTDIPRIEMESTDTTSTIEPNTLYVFPEMAILEITIGGTVDTSIVQEYRFRFTSGATATTLTLPADVVGEMSVEANKVYEVSILDGYLVSQSWEVA